MNKEFEKFVSNSIQKCPPMKVEVLNEKNVLVDVYETPPGFQLDLYVASLFPTADLMVTGSPFDITVSVVIPDTSEIYQMHHGKFQRVQASQKS